MERTTGARKSLPVLGAALAMGLALLFPAVSPAAGGRTAPADPAFVQYLKRRPRRRPGARPRPRPGADRLDRLFPAPTSRR